MKQAQKYSKEDVALINDELKEEWDFLNQTLHEIFTPPLPSPLKSIKDIDREQNMKINATMELLQRDIQLAIEFYFAECGPKDQPRLREIFAKIAQLNNFKEKDEIKDEIKDEVDRITEEDRITIDDFKFLEELAKARLIRRLYGEASCMYRFILKINPGFSSGWVGWAICEEEQGHMEVVEYIYQLAGELLPFDHYITLFAADFFVSTDRKEKAKILLENAKSQLEADHMENSKTFEEIELSLKNL
ncbi:MAG: hypothetical protein H0X26_10120 [Alphaproteobacteria bacterium]|nr:hypothetical protein [Alphaproteobacteria bacterium]